MTKKEFEDKINFITNQTAKETFDLIQSFVFDKVKYWQAVPYFALLASEESWTDEDQTVSAFKKKQWNISPSSDDIYVDLTNGKIIGQYKSILYDWIEYQYIEVYDGECVIPSLIRDAKNNKIEEKWRQKALKKYNIEIPHTILTLL